MSGAILPLALAGVEFEVGGARLLGPLDLRLEAGSRTLILGPNGAGKSLTLRIAHGLVRPTQGEVRWEGTDAKRSRRHQAMVFERPVLLRRSAIANVEYALARRGLDRSARKCRAEEALERTGLSELARRPARVLSAGEQQRLALARAWALAPEVLFLDEPTASLDPTATRAIEEQILDLSQLGTKVVMTTHDLGQARRLADEILFLCGGRLVERAAADVFFARPESDLARKFLEGELLW